MFVLSHRLMAQLHEGIILYLGNVDVSKSGLFPLYQNMPANASMMYRSTALQAHSRSRFSDEVR